jgi:putative protease
MSRKPEVMSPAGYWPQIHAAIEAGANSVYFGLKRFSARAKVGFEVEELPEVMRTLHARGVRGYLTFNTLIFENELSDATSTIALIAQAGVDAVIVQDLGTMALIRQIAPTLEIHASTQMSITDAAGVRFAQSFGATRVTLARELSLKDLRRIKAETDCELEIFVHGALCVAYSGQCFSSEAWGGRSANRGQCAQACRLPYDLIVDGALEPLGDARYLLSPEDLFALEQVPELAEIGIAALKIEGRYKDADYVALTTRAYRQAVDASTPPAHLAQQKQQLEQVYSRGLGAHFLSGVNHQAVVRGRSPRHRGVLLGEVAKLETGGIVMQPANSHQLNPVKPGDGLVFDAADWRSPQESEEGGRVFEVFAMDHGQIRLSFANGALDPRRIRIGDWIWRSSDTATEKAARVYTEATSPQHQQPVSVQIVAREGEPLRTRWTVGAHTIHADSEQPLGNAQTRALSEELLVEQFGRLGGTAYRLEALTLERVGSPFAPMSLLNQVRRNAVAKLEAEQSQARPHLTTTPNLHRTQINPQLLALPQVHLLVRTEAQLEAALSTNPASITLDFLDLYGIRKSISQTQSAGIPVRVATPRLLKPDETRILDFLLSLNCAILVRSAGMLERLCRSPHPLTGDFSLNTANSQTAAAYLERGCQRLTPTHDLNANQIATLARDIGPHYLEVALFHHLPVFHTEHCVFCRFLSTGTSYLDCGRPCETHQIALRDERGRQHAVMADVGCRNTVFGAEAQQPGKHLKQWLDSRIVHFRVEFAHETADQVRRVTEICTRAVSGKTALAQWNAELRAVLPSGITEGSLTVPELRILQT